MSDVKKAKINLIIPALTENRVGKCLDLNRAFILKLLIPSPVAPGLR